MISTQPATTMAATRALKLKANHKPNHVAVQRTDNDPVARAERVFGCPSHLVLVSDKGPALSIMGWTLGAGRADVREGPGATRTTVIEIMFTETGRYAVCERVGTQGEKPDAKALTATLTEFESPRDVRRYCETSSFDSARDMALAAALDHATRVWPWLRRPARVRAVRSLTLPFAV